MRPQRLLHTVPLRLRSLFQRKHVETELDEELRDHVERQTQDNIARGMDPEEARFAALRAIGGIDQRKEECRDARGVNLIHDFIQDLRYAARALRRTPGFTLVAVLTLALGIGANTAIFSVVNSVLLRPLPYRDSERLVAVFLHEKRLGERQAPTSPFDFHQWQQSGAFESMAAATPWGPVLTGYDRPDHLAGLRASANLFAMLGAEAAIGRTFRAEEGQPGNHRVIVLGHDLWQRRFGGDRDMVGRTLQLDDEPYIVIGVMPPGFRFPPFWHVQAEFWTPLVFTPQERDRHARMLRVFARLTPSITVERAQSEMDAIALRLEKEYPQSNTGVGINVEPLQEPVVRAVRPTLLALLGAASFVLLIGCANIATLLLARAAGRTREIAVRLALGASRGRLVRQLLTENLLLAAVSGFAGVLLGRWWLDVLRALLTDSLPRVAAVNLDGRVLAFAAGASLLVALATGLAPALQANRGALADALKSGSRQADGPQRRLRSALVVTEVALAVILLTGAGLLLQSVWRLANLDPGFRREQLLTATVSFAGPRYETVEQQSRLLDELQQRVGALPGVASAALVNHLPIGGDVWRFQFLVEGQVAPPPVRLPLAVYRAATPGAFRTMGIRVVRGREFAAGDTARSEPVVLVNETLARRYFPGQDPVGRRLRMGPADSTLPWLTIIGVTGDVRQGALAAEIPAEMYVPYSQQLTEFYRSATLVIQGRGETAPLESTIQRAVWTIDSNIPVTGIRSIEQLLEGEVRQPRRQGWLIASFAGAALLLAGIGLYGVVSYLVARRTKEIGVRMALGARPADVSRLVVKQGLRLALAGVAIGLAGAAVLTRAIEDMLFQTSATDAATFAGVSLLLTIVALLACYLPARRAARVDPMVALRYE